jgi:excisionase family DNA binding protein
MVDTDDPMLTVDEIARLLRVSKWVVYRLISNKHLNAVKVGRVLRVRQSAYSGYVAKNNTAPAHAMPRDGDAI